MLLGSDRMQELRPVIDAANEWIYNSINNGVYRCGFATTQAAYTAAFHELREALGRADALLSKQRYVAGSRLTEADVRLVTTLLRFDHVYVIHFKCAVGLIQTHFPNLHGLACELYQLPAVSGTFNVRHTKDHYYKSHISINPRAIVPVGFDVDFDRPHGRDALRADA